VNEPDIERRARRLVALYPAAWRERFGEEFEQLLLDEMHERPRNGARTCDVAAHAMWARLVDAGLVSRGSAPSRAWLALRGLAVVSAVFVVVGLGMWSQLTIGWQWSAPSDSATRAGMLMMSGALLGLGGLVLLALLPISWSALRAVCRRRPAAGRGPLLFSLASGVTFCVACRHFGAGWPGTGGHPWADRGLVPGGVARIAWAGTLWISAYWAHPGALHTFPPAEILWMAVSPLLIVTSLVGALRFVRDLEPPSGVLRWLAILGGAGVALAAVFVAGATSWVFSGAPGPHGLFDVGLIDDLSLLLLGGALVAGSRTARRAITATVRPIPR
jgi:hypothetical protein